MLRNDELMRHLKDALRRVDFSALLRSAGEKSGDLKKAVLRNPARYLVQGLVIAVILGLFNSLISGPMIIDVIALMVLLGGGLRSIYAIVKAGRDNA